MKMYWKSSEMFRKCIEKFKCSCNLCVTKVDNNLEITSVHFSLDFGNKIWIGKPFINMVCHFKTLHLGCPFMPPVSFEIVYCRFFWSDFSSFLLSDYTSRSSSSSRSIKRPSNSVRYSCQKICSWSGRPKTILEMTKRPHFYRWSMILLFTSFLKTLLTTESRQ